MTEDMKQVLEDLRARQLALEHMPCPRCGRDAMNSNPLRNALSRCADIQVCDDCGTDEALRGLWRSPLPLEQWACFQPEASGGEWIPKRR